MIPTTVEDLDSIFGGTQIPLQEQLVAEQSK